MATESIPEQLAREFKQLGQSRPGDSAQPVATFSAKPWEAYTLVAALQGASRHPGLTERQREMVLGFAHQVGDQLVAMAGALIGPDTAIETTIVMGFDPQFDVPRDQEWRCPGCGETHGGLCRGCGQRHPACSCPPAARTKVQEAEYPEPWETWDDGGRDGDRCVVCGCTDMEDAGGCDWVARGLCSTDDEAHQAYRRENGILGDRRSHMVGEQLVRYVNPTWVRLATDDEDDELKKCALCGRFFLQSVPLQLFQDLGDKVVLGFDVCDGCAPKVLTRMRQP